MMIRPGPLAHTTLGLAGVSALILLAGGLTNRSQAQPTVAPALGCSALADRTFVDVQVTSAVPIASDGAVPAYCRVRGTQVGTQHDIEVRLPQTWLERYVQEGGGGFDGVIPPVGAKDVALSLGAVQTANNGGHRDPSGADFLNNPSVVRLYAHTAILSATRFGKAVAQAYYGRAPRYSYYEGCSNGGRGALNAAARYGGEFDGVVAGAPTINVTGQIEQWTRAAALTLPDATQLSAIHAAEVAKCDALDGAKDGIISNWSACRFDPTTDAPASIGLTSDQARSVKALLTDLDLADGKTIYSGYGFGDMAPLGKAYAALGVGHMRDIVLNDPAWQPSSFSVDAYPAKIFAVIETKYGFSAPVPGLARFLDAGKKIILWQGSGDALLSHKDTLRTWGNVTRAAGAGADNSRFYIASGVGHCVGGAGADTFDLLTPLVAWVEHGEAPGPIVASKLKDGAVEFTRPMCVYPAFPKYRGTGDMKAASSFQCTVG